jgi:NitT/TauT family transport system substrate-binding protein
MDKVDMFSFDNHNAQINRRHFLRRAAMLGLSVTGAATVVSGCGAPQAAAPSRTNTPSTTPSALANVRMACWSQPLVEQTNIYAAQEFGWFAAHGLDFTFVPSAGGGDALKNSLAGNADFAFTNVEPLLFALQEGAQLRAVYNIYPQNVFNVVALQTTGLASIADLKDRKVGVYSQASGTRYNLLVLLRSVGLTESDVEVIAAGIANFGPLQQGQVAGMAATDTGLYAAQQAGMDNVDIWWARDVLNTPSDVFVVTEETYRTQPDMISGFLQAYKQGSQWMLQHPDQAAELATKYATDGQNVQRNRAIIDLRNASSVAQPTGAKGLGFFDHDLLNTVTATFLDLGITKQHFDIDMIFTNEFVDKL